MKKSNNKGFSLVELIVVVAIMAVLVGVLAPAYLKYVESSRVSKDLTNVDEIVRAVEVALADEEIFDSVEFGTGNTSITLTFEDEATSVTVTSGATCTDLLDEVEDALGTITLDLGSKALDEGKLEVTIAEDFKVSHKLYDGDDAEYAY